MQKLIEIFQRFVTREEEWLVLRKDGHQNVLFQMYIRIHPLMQDVDNGNVVCNNLIVDCMRSRKSGTT